MLSVLGGRCGLWEGRVPAFQDVGSVGIPAIRRRESGLLRTEHLSPWRRCPVSTLDLGRPENEVSERLNGSPRCLVTGLTASQSLASPPAWTFLVTWSAAQQRWGLQQPPATRPPLLPVCCAPCPSSSLSSATGGALDTMGEEMWGAGPAKEGVLPFPAQLAGNNLSENIPAASAQATSLVGMDTHPASAKASGSL